MTYKLIRNLIIIFLLSTLAPGCSEKNTKEISPIISVEAKDLEPLYLWSNNGEDKVTQDELRAARGQDVKNSVWDGEKVKVFGASNEVVAFNLVLEAPLDDLNGVKVEFNKLEGPAGYAITSKPLDLPGTGSAGSLSPRQSHTGDSPQGTVPQHGLFNFVGRNIELFYVRYLQIKGVGRLLYMPDYDERHVPEKLRLPYTLPKGTSKGKFEDRPNANKFYPDIAVPIEAVGAFDIAANSNQGIWVDVYIPKNAPAGVYKGTITVTCNMDPLPVAQDDDHVIPAQAGIQSRIIPVELEVLPFALPDVPSAKTMVYYSDANINDRYLGKKWPERKDMDFGSAQFMDTVWLNHHKIAHRHKISLIDGGLGLNMEYLQQWPDQYTFLWTSILNGSAFTSQHGYDGPGVSTSSGVYSIGTYGSWKWKNQWNSEDKQDIWKRSDIVVKWFETVFPDVEYFIYLLDEPHGDKFAEIETWAKWFKENPGPGKRLKTFVTSGLPKIEKHMPSVDIGFTGWGDPEVWKPLVEKYLREGKISWTYNGGRPSTGSFATEDEGVALRVNGWIHFKHKIGRWFYWESTHYKNTSHVSVETNVFRSAWTFGRKGDKPHPKYGETGPNYSNGDGVLFYPGTEKRFPEDNYDLPGPIASLRLKLWRRGIQDVDYLTLAHKIDPEAVDQLVQEMIPKVLWEVGVTDPKDPSYVHADISWSTDPDLWEAARRQLADIIISGIDVNSKQ